MNLILFEPGEIGAPLPLTDSRAIHLIKVLGRGEGGVFDAGVVDGRRGKGTITSIAAGRLMFAFDGDSDPAPPDPIDVVVAIPRPQTARRILAEATSLGVASIRFFQSEKGEPGYASSTLWRTFEWRKRLMEGAAQAFDTRLPEVVHHRTLEDSVAALPAESARIALDNYEAPRRMVPPRTAGPIALAFGPERGWSAAERTLLRGRGFEFAHLGPRVLRTETAVVAAISLAKSGP